MKPHFLFGVHETYARDSKIFGWLRRQEAGGSIQELGIKELGGSIQETGVSIQELVRGIKNNFIQNFTLNNLSF
ncbi:hypothetical protein V0288_12630 [Pannus brasiliensis CCIBt3594]|uniref:Uncharacterized protein n=1 Tax=Pannus brasiliensis CCIBt3594 TaxID=1427578 RepID=A0AAW9QSY0_9CHRO